MPLSANIQEDLNPDALEVVAEADAVPPVCEPEELVPVADGLAGLIFETVLPEVNSLVVLLSTTTRPEDARLSV